MTKKVLIAEDRTDSRRLLEDILGMFANRGVVVLTARNGEEAYGLALKEHPDLILLDVMMPKMTGLEVCRKIREDPELAEVHIIMVSAKFQEEDREEAEAAGANEYITKPYDVAEIIARVQSILGLNL